MIIGIVIVYLIIAGGVLALYAYPSIGKINHNAILEITTMTIAALLWPISLPLIIILKGDNE